MSVVEEELKLEHVTVLNLTVRRWKADRVPRLAVRECFILSFKSQKIFIYSRYYAEACNKLRGSSPRLSVGATQLRSNVAAVESL